MNVKPFHDGHRKAALRWSSMAALTLLALATLSCQLRDQILFDDPYPHIVLETPMYKASQPGGAIYWGTAKNDGTLEALEVKIGVTIYGQGNVNLGTYYAYVGTKVYVENNVEYLDTSLGPGEVGSFILLVPVPYARIAAETVEFSFELPVEEEEP